MADPVQPVCSIRAATAGDVAEIARLLTVLGHATTAADVAARWPQWTAAGSSAFVADAGGRLLGVATLHRMVVLHRPRPVGRITSLVVDEADRGKGVGRALVAAAEAELAKDGCGLIEITSNLRRVDAHAFYEQLGYERTSYRFFKKLVLLLLLLAAPLAAQRAATTTPASTAVREVGDLAYYTGVDADPKKHKLDLYLPAGAAKVPVVMWIHGGGWSLGDRWWYGEIARRFAEAGVGFAAISYRLSPKVKHPAHVQDCARAFAWLFAHVAEHGGDPERLFVAGQSAGGHLAALLACDPQYLRALDVPEGALKGAIPMSGVYQIPALPATTIGLGAMFPAAFGSDEKSCAAASPMNHVATLRCPMLVITETDDMGILRASTALLRAAAEKAGVSGIRFVDAKDRNHISIVTALAQKRDEPVRAAMLDFVRQRCRELEAKNEAKK